MSQKALLIDTEGDISALVAFYTIAVGNYQETEKNAQGLNLAPEP